MKTFALTLFLLFITITSAFAQEAFPFYHSRNSFQLTSPGAMKYGLYGYDNPALLTYIDKFDMQFNWSDRYSKWNDFDEWGLFAAIPNIGFSVIHTELNRYAVNDYNISAATGSRAFSLGADFKWSSGDDHIFSRTSLITVGALYRPIKYISAGITGTFSTTVSSKEAYVDLAVRPLGDERISLFADAAIRNNTLFDEKKEHWSAGAAVELIPGLRITGRYFDTKNITTGVQLSFGNFGIGSQAHFDDKQKHSYNSYSIRVGQYDRNFISKVFAPKKYVEMNLIGGIKYNRYKFFDNSNTLYELLTWIKEAKNDRNISGIVINTSGISARREFLWELRESLKEFKLAGKKVLIYIDRPSMEVYHFASVADVVAMDPLGLIQLPGYLSGRTYYKGTAEKLGIGVDILRFFKYKSAYENFGADSMSEGEKEQSQRVIDNFYNIAKENICTSRKINPADYDGIINNLALISASEARTHSLVDTLCRWDDVKAFASNDKAGLMSARAIEKFKLPEDNHWGEPSRIAVIYAEGSTSMDDGINARKLIKDFQNAAADPLVKAIVLRVDSPGGDGMASDYIAAEMKKNKGKKPIIVSQGNVAASGGYVLSMYADTIVTAPQTITGSIGVIAGWFYNKGLKEKLGMATDHIQRGEHADLMFGPSLPFIGLSIPDRPLTEYERGRAELLIRDQYKDFVTKVADSRSLSYEYVDSIAQGRVWTGMDAKDLKLVDVIGGLDTAIKIAREKAGIGKNEFVKVIQYPDMPWFSFDFLVPKFFGLNINVEEDPLIKDLKFRIQNNGIPMPMMDVEYMEYWK